MSSVLKKIPYVNLKNQWETERDDLLPIIDKVLSSGKYVGGEEVEIFEESIAKFCDVKYSVALNSGTDALMFALMLSGVRKGDEVITPPNSFVASTSTILHVGAKPVFVDVLPDQNIDPSKIEEAITKNTKAIMPVHLTGRMCDMDPIMEIAERHNLIVIEDAAQAFGSKYRGKPQAQRVIFFLADSYFQIKRYISASSKYENFIKSYPKSERIEEAVFKGAKSYYYLSPKYSLDQKDTFIAIEKLQVFINLYLSLFCLKA